MKKQYWLLIIAFLISITTQSQKIEDIDTKIIHPPEDCNFILSPDNVYLGNTSGSFFLKINAADENCLWSYTDNARWLSPSVNQGAGTELITVSYSANTGSEERDAIITIAGIHVSVVQLGEDPPPPPCPDYEPVESITISSPINDNDCRIYDGVIKARDFVKLNRSFSYSASDNNPLTIKTDPQLLCPVNYNYSQFDGSDRNIDTTLEVGSLPGSVNVSPTGAATYTIPIEVPQGTAGMQPNLSITYNSQQGKSKLGKGFKIGGLSAISKVPQTYYHDDGNVSGLQIDSFNDRYVLDGQRLILIQGNLYGGPSSEYRTEQNTFSKIVARDNAIERNFTVETKDGKTFEYGNTPNSKLIIPGFSCPYAFYLSKVTDKNGNFMTYTYGQSNGEIWIKRIDYTGNTGLSPYNSINFYYDERPDQKSSYISGVEVTPKRLLREIVVKTNDNLVRKYKFKYFEDDLEEMCLNEIVLSNQMKEEYNSTLINWGELNFYNIFFNIVDVPTNYLANYDEQYYSASDVNGDGLTDLIGFFPYEINTGWGRTELYNGVQVYTAESDENGNIFFTNGMFKSMSPSIDWDDFTAINAGPIFGDLYGKGVKDLITPIYYIDIQGRVVKFIIHNRDKEITVPLNDNELPLYTLTDLDRDGRINIIFLENLEVNGYYKGAVLETVGDVDDDNLEVSELDLELNSEPKNIFTGDYNKDGLTDLRVATASKIYTYLNREGSINTNAHDITSYSNIHGTNFRQDDFNGDGLPDLLIIGENDENLAVAYGVGADYSGCSLDVTYFPSISSTDDPYTDRDDDKDNCIVTDFNNDGLSDFILFDAVYDWGIPHKDFKELNTYWYRSTGDGFHLEKTATTDIMEQAYKKYFVSGDFNGDGRVDLINYGYDCYNETSTTNAWRFYHTFNTDFDANKVTTIYNGFNQKTEINYRPLSEYSDDSDFYTKGTSGIDDVIKIQGPLYVVSTIKQPDGDGGISTTSYTYEGLRAHNKGKGMLGFEKMTEENDATKIKNITTSTLDPDYFVVDNVTIQNYFNGNLISRNVTDFETTTYVDYPKLVFNHPVTITNENVLTNTTITKNNFSYDEYGNLLTVREKYGFKGTVDITNTYVKSGAWCKSRLANSIINTKYSKEPVDSKTYYYFYDDKGNVLTNKSNDITITIQEDDYDQFGNVLEKKTTATGVNGNKIEKFTYDNTGRFIKTATNVLDKPSTYNYNDLGQLISETGVDGLTSRYTYDHWGKLKTVNYPNGKKTTYSKGWINNGAYQFYTLDQTEGTPDVKIYHDYLGRKVRTETIGFKGKMYSDIFYNRKGQVIEKRSPYYVDDGYSSSHVKTFSYSTNDGRAESITSNDLTKSLSYSGKTVTETFPSGKTKETTVDAFGNIVNVENNGLSINYSYFSNGQLKEVTAPGSSLSMTYDANGFQESLTDPDAGTYNFDYNPYGQLESKTTPIGSYTADYDVAGRVITETGYGEISYTYVESGNGINQVESIMDGDNEFMHFDYDEYDRIREMTEQVGDQSMSVNYEYDDNGRTIAINYPGGFGIKYVYDEASGELKEIYTDKDRLIWQLQDVNSHNQVTQYKLGNNMVTQLGYDANQVISSINTNNKAVQDITLTYDETNGRFDNRKGLLFGVTENFAYDDDGLNFNQLEAVNSTDNPALNLSLSYNRSVPGQIESKSDVGTYQYTQERNAGPHAISGITNVNANYTPTDQDITYTDFGKVAVITQGNYRVEFNYGPDQARKTMEVYHNGSLERKVYYFGNYELHVEGSNITELYYIYAPSGLAAIYKKDNGATQGDMYYVHTDHLGSIHAITNDETTPAVAARYYYNPWGEQRFVNKDNGDEFQSVNDLEWLHRGFTGHEHITEIGLINMNGRVYDPDLGMFISCDPQLQAPDNPINFNRYAYCLNNPLIYTDPSGEIVWAPIIIGAIIGTYMGGTIANDGNYNPVEWDYSSGKTWGYMGAGLVVGGLSGYVGGAIAAAEIPMANTLGIMGASLTNSVGTYAYTGGQTDISMSFGVGSYNFSQNEWGYLGKEGNTALENIGYTFGALANLSDAVSLFSGGGQNVDVNSASTKDDWWGHSSMTDENGKTLVSVGPDTPVQKAATLSDTWNNSIKGAKLWDSYVGDKGTWTTRLNNVSTSAINNYASGMTRWDLLLNSCVGHTTRALMRAGVPTIYAFHPHMLNLQLLIRQVGIYSSPYLYQIPK